MALPISPAEIDALLARMTPEKMAETLAMLEELDTRKRLAAAREDFLAFIALLDSTYKFGTHLKRLGRLLMDVEADTKDRVAVSMAPRFGKSQMISVLYPAWYLGRHPDHKVIVASHTADLAVDMARKVRNLMQTAEYRKIFPDVSIAGDAKAAGKWNTNKGGEYYAVGVGGALAGRGGHLIIVDDPLSEQDIKNGNFAQLEVVYEWFRTGLRTRLMPNGKIVVLHTRWHMRDLIGRLIKDGALNSDTDQYEMFEFPAILGEDSDNPKSLWPEQWSLESLLRTKASMPLWQWNAQYMQNPTAAESAMIKREWIQWWPHENPPDVEFIVQGWDTALTAKQRSDWSVCHTWGVWTTEEGETHAILLNSAKGKWEFPELKQAAFEQYNMWQPDALVIETKASGQPLVDELRRSGIFVTEFSPGKGNDKVARVNSVSDMFSAGHVWFPETSWAQATVEEIVSFPVGEHDDECLVAGTRITMADGTERPIEQVKVGDFVATPFGPREVTYAACTGVHPVRTVAGLTGTENHPVATARGWVPLWQLTPEDDVLTVATAGGAPGGLPAPQEFESSPSWAPHTETPESALVYNLSVAEVECYFANGVLVHNCDAMTLCLRRVRTGGLLRLSTDQDDNEAFIRSRRRRAYY